MAKNVELLDNGNEILYPRTVTEQVAVTANQNLKEKLNEMDANIESVTNEVEDARTDNKAQITTHKDLKARLDSDFNTINNSLNEMYYYVTPEMFGYKKGEIINDSLQKCFDFCKDNGGGTIVVKNGKHLVSGTMSMYKNTRLILEEGAIMVCQGATPTPLINGEATDNFTEYNGNGNIYIEGGTWVSNSQGQPESTRNIFGFAHADGITIRNVIFKNVKSSHAIDLNSSKNVLIEKCQFLGYKDADDGSRTFAEAIQIAEHTQLGFNAIGSFDSTPCKNVTIRSCYFGASDYYGAWGSGVGNHSSVHDIFQENIVVDDCVFEGMLYAGVRAFKWNNVIVKNSIFKNCLTGIIISSVKGGGLSSQDKDGVQTNLCQSGKGYFVSNNVFEDCKKQSISIGGQVNDQNHAFISDIDISHNVFKYSTQNANVNTAIFLQRISNYNVADNFFENPIRAFWLRYTNFGTIENNIITDALYEGVYISEDTSDPDHINILNGNYYSHSLQISNNRVVNCGRAAFNIGYTDRITVNNNVVVNACHETDGTRNAIVFGSNTKNSEAFNNKVEQVAVQRNKYGLEITGTCSNMLAYNNDCYGKDGGVSYSTTAIREIGSVNSIKWIDCALANGVTSYGTGHTPQFTKNVDGMVTIRGAVTHNKTFRDVLFTLPEGYRPKINCHFATIASNQQDPAPHESVVHLNRIYISPNGEVKLESSTSVSDNPFTTLNISFYTN